MADWDKLKSRGRVDDRRTNVASFGLMGTGVVALLITFSLAQLGIDVSPNTVSTVLETFNSSRVSQQEQPAEFRGDDPYEVFASKILGSTNDTWSEIFRQNNSQYTEPTLVLYRNSSHTACGIGSSNFGPFYCPNDSTIYLDETFFDELKSRFGGSSGETAQAYVIAHEVGHHVQNLQGSLAKSARTTQKQSIETELQADCYAGVWAHSISRSGVINESDIEEALSAASAVGDDNIQSKSGSKVNPETWTHGSSQDRTNAFRLGYSTGQPGRCTGLAS